MTRLVEAPKRLYNGTVGRVIRDIGVESRVRRTYHRLRGRLVPDEVTIVISDVEASFEVATDIEYERLDGRLLETNRPVLEDLVAEIGPSDVLWDVGAHLGRYSCVVGQVLADGQVVAVEAHPENVPRLRSNLERNGVDATVVPKALADQRTSWSFSVSHNAAGEFLRGADYHDERQRDGATVEIETVTGDDLLERADIRRPSVVRIDVTGGEPAALDGLDSVLSDARCRLVYVTVYEDRYDEPDAVASRLHDHGFETETVQEDLLKATR